MKAPRILVVDRGGALFGKVRAALAAVRPDITVEACSRPANMGEVLERGGFDVLVAGPGLSTRAGLAKLELVREEIPYMSIVLVVDHRPPASTREVVRTGACDLLQLPTQGHHLAAVLTRAVRLASLARPPETAGGADEVRAGPATPTGPDAVGERRAVGQVLTTASATGGCGKTFLATNLAYFLHTHTRKPTCLVDLDLQFGEVTTALRLRPHYTIFDAVSRADGTEDDLQGCIESYVVSHETGFEVLAAPREPAEADQISAPDITRIIDAVRRRFEYVVVDTPSALSEVVLTAFDMSDTLFTIATLDLPSVRNLGVFLNQLERLKIPADSIRLILNKAERDVGIDVGQVTRLFPKQFNAVLPYAREVSRSINVGMPVMAATPHAPISRLLAGSLRELLPPEAQSRVATEVRTGRARFFGRLSKRAMRGAAAAAT